MLFREMLDGFALHEILCDAEGRPCDYRFLAVNPAFERMTGYKADELIGRRLDLLFPEDSREGTMKLIAGAMEGRHWETEEIQIRRKDGTARDLIWNSATIMAADDKTVVATIAQGQDITDRKKAEHNSLRLQSQVARMQKMESVGRLAGWVAHDFNNMLPEMNGRELARVLRERIPSLKCLFMCGYSAVALDGPGALEGCDGFLQKPFTRDALARILREVLDGQV